MNGGDLIKSVASPSSPLPSPPPPIIIIIIIVSICSSADCLKFYRTFFQYVTALRLSSFSALSAVSVSLFLFLFLRSFVLFHHHHLFVFFVLPLFILFIFFTRTCTQTCLVSQAKFVHNLTKFRVRPELKESCPSHHIHSQLH